MYIFSLQLVVHFSLFYFSNKDREHVIITITGKLKRLMMNDFYYDIFTCLDISRSMDKSNYSFKLNQDETSSTLYERSRPPPLNLGPKRSIS